MKKQIDRQLKGMRKMQRGILALMLLFAVTTASAQVSFGLKAGLNMSETTLKDLPQNTSVSNLLSIKNKEGFFVGPTLRVSLPISFIDFDVAALYDLRRTEIEGQDFDMKSIAVPANVRINIPIPVVGIYVAGGPQFNFNVGDDEFSWTDKQNLDNTFRLKSSTFSVNVGGGIRISHFEAGVTYNIPVGNTSDITSVIDTAQKIYETRQADTNTWKVSVAFYF